jgi:hypothetical protein
MLQTSIRHTIFAYKNWIQNGAKNGMRMIVMQMRRNSCRIQHLYAGMERA